MVVFDEYRAVATRMQALLDELDRLKLANIAIHVDLALNRLEGIIACHPDAAPEIAGN